METTNYLQFLSVQEQQKSHIYLLQNNKSIYLKINLGCLKMLNTELPYGSRILLLSIYPREMKTCVHTKTCTQMFTATLFIIARK